MARPANAPGQSASFGNLIVKDLVRKRRISGNTNVDELVTGRPVAAVVRPRQGRESLRLASIEARSDEACLASASGVPPEERRVA